jgi:hypothetical protein
MKTNKSLLAILLTLTLLLTACQPHAASSPVAPPENTSAPEANAASPEASTPPAATGAPQAQNSSLFANISELAGKVELKQAGQPSFIPANTGDQVGVNGQVQTGSDGRTRLDLSSGTIIRVSPSSLFTLTVNEEVQGGLLTKIELELGKIFIILNGGSAEVNTPTGVAAVEGSYLKVEFDPATGTLTLTCLEGNCSVTTPSGEKKSFTDGQKIVIHKDASGNWVLDEGPMSPEDFQEWLDNNPEAKDLVDQAGGSSGGGGDCSNIIQPGEGSSLPTQGKIKFEWSAQPGAAKYIVKFTGADGKTISFETSNTNIQQYIESFMPDAGPVSWSVTPLDANGNPICTSETSTFDKPDSNWNRPNGDDGSGGDPVKDKDPYCTSC